MSNVIYLNDSYNNEQNEKNFELDFEQIRNLTESVMFRMRIQPGHELTGNLGFPSASNNRDAVMQWIESNQNILAGKDEAEWTGIMASTLAEKMIEGFEDDWFGECQ
jgi:hypothetical protein